MTELIVLVTRSNLVQDLIVNKTREDKAHRARCNLDKQQLSHVPGHPVSFRLYVFHFRGISNQTVTRSVKPVDIKLFYFNRYTDTQQMRLNKLDGIMHQ